MDVFKLQTRGYHVILFTFRNDLLTQVEQMKTALQLNTQPYLAVHLRTGFVGSPHVKALKLASGNLRIGNFLTSQFGLAY